MIDDDRELTYAALDRCVDSIAAALQAAGVSRGDLVAVCLSRTVDLAAGLLAVHRLGAGYLPPDPEYPADRLDFMVADSSPRAVLADTGTAATAVRFCGPTQVDITGLPAGTPTL